MVKRGTRGARLLRPLLDVAQYAAVPMVSALAPLLALPALSREIGASGWAAVAIGQSLGSGAAVIGELGWSVVGPQRVARATPALRQLLLVLSLTSRAASALALLPAVAVLAWLLARDHKGIAAATGAAFALGSLSVAWFLIGLGKPHLLLLLDALPRLFLTGAAAITISATGAAWLYPLSVASGFLVALGLTLAWSQPQMHLFRRSAPLTRAVFRRQGVLTAGRAISASYTALPITLVGLAHPAAVPAFAALDRVMRMGLLALSAVPQKLQSWLGSAAPEHVWRRARGTLWISVATGMAAAVTLWFVGPFAIEFLFAGAVQVSDLTLATACVVAALVSVSRGLGLVLVRIGRANSIARASAASAAAGVPAILALSHAIGAPGGFIGEATAEFVGIAVQVHTLSTQRGLRTGSPLPTLARGRGSR